MKKIVFSHSKISTLLKCPMSYNLSYNHKIFPKFEKDALSLGSAVHYAIENNITDLTEYYEQNSKFKNKLKINDERILAEAMVSGYFKHKEKLFNDILYDEETGEILECLEEIHEIELEGILKSKVGKSLDYGEYNYFLGIIDLLLLTEKGFIVIDYKTSSRVPEWNKYLDQLYRYIFLLKSVFPDIPVYKIAIINLRKSSIKRKTSENDSSFRRRLDIDYQLNDEKHIDSHVFKRETINEDKLNEYINNLATMCDAGLTLINNETYYTNYSALDDYGGSDFKELILGNESVYTLYNVRDKCYNEITGCIEDYRDMRLSDYKNIFNKVYPINKYKTFCDILDKISYELGDLNDEEIWLYKENIQNCILSEYEVDLELLNLYWKTWYELTFNSKNESK